jgi:phosphatidylglycerophosphatase A
VRRAILFLASAAYVGYVPVASGTFGSLVAIPLFWVFGRLSAAQSAAAFAGVVAAACWIAGKAEDYLQEHDSHKIVIDEIAGYLAATLFLAPSAEAAWIAFAIFRLLDVLKPFPASYVDARFPGGLGIVLDDVISGAYANVLTRVALRLLG